MPMLLKLLYCSNPPLYYFARYKRTEYCDMHPTLVVFFVCPHTHTYFRNNMSELNIFSMHAACGSFGGLLPVL